MTWISIDDRLPELDEPVFLCHAPSRNLWIGCRVCDDDPSSWQWHSTYGCPEWRNDRWHCDSEYDSSLQPSHWHPLPEWNGDGDKATEQSLRDVMLELADRWDREQESYGSAWSCDCMGFCAEDIRYEIEKHCKQQHECERCNELAQELERLRDILSPEDVAIIDSLLENRNER